MARARPHLGDGNVQESSASCRDTQTDDHARHPRAGLLAHVRNRHGVIVAATPFDGESGRLHLVDVDYKDARQPARERLLWELEPVRDVVGPTALPDAAAQPMPPPDFDALLRAASALLMPVPPAVELQM